MLFCHISEYLACIGLSHLDAVILSQAEISRRGVPFQHLVKNIEKDFKIEGIQQLYQDLIDCKKNVSVAEIEGSVLSLIERGYLIQYTQDTVNFIVSVYSSPPLRPFLSDIKSIKVGNTAISYLGYHTVQYIRKFMDVHCIFGGCETRVLSDEKHLCYFSSDAQLIRDELEYFDLEEEPVIEKCGPWVCNHWWDIRPAGYRCTIPIPKELKES